MDYKFETRCIHRENEHEEGHPYGSVCTPIYQTATFYHPGIGQTTGFNYTRESNPTRTELEDIVTSLEEAKDTVACANGMAAIVLCTISCAQRICMVDLCVCSRHQVRSVA